MFYTLYCNLFANSRQTNVLTLLTTVGSACLSKCRARLQSFWRAHKSYCADQEKKKGLKLISYKVSARVCVVSHCVF